MPDTDKGFFVTERAELSLVVLLNRHVFSASRSESPCRFVVGAIGRIVTFKVRHPRHDS